MHRESTYPGKERMDKKRRCWGDHRNVSMGAQVRVDGLLGKIR